MRELRRCLGDISNLVVATRLLGFPPRRVEAAGIREYRNAGVVTATEYAGGKTDYVSAATRRCTLGALCAYCNFDGGPYQNKIRRSVM